MEIFNWLFSIENKVVYVVGSIALKDLRNAMTGFMEALRVVQGTYADPIYPGFQRFVEKKFEIKGDTAKGWTR